MDISCSLSAVLGSDVPLGWPLVDVDDIPEDPEPELEIDDDDEDEDEDDKDEEDGIAEEDELDDIKSLWEFLASVYTPFLSLLYSVISSVSFTRLSSVVVSGLFRLK